MKRLVLCLMLLFVATSIHAQDTTDLPTNLKALSLEDKSWFREAGFPITKYNFGVYDINQELSLGLDERKKAKTLSTISWASMGAGMLTSVIGATSAKGGTGVTVAGGLMMVGGLTVNLFTNAKKKKAFKRIQNAAYLYEDMN